MNTASGPAPVDRAGALDRLLPLIRDSAPEIDRSAEWPAKDLLMLAQAGSARWAVPHEYGGDGLSPLELHLCYERIAAASATIALILTQRDSAVGLIEESDNAALRHELLPGLAQNHVFMTVGIAQLTTSRQRGAPALRARRTGGDGWRLDGEIPWCTGAAHAGFIVTGAVTADGGQILFALPRSAEGVHVGDSLPLVALRASATATITCREVILPDRFRLKGPCPSVLAGRKRSLPIGQTFLAMGLGRAALDLIAGHDSPAARLALERLGGRLDLLRREIIELCQPGRETEATDAAPRIRGACNDLVLRLAHTAVALYKGRSLLLDHPAQRLAREALFLLVWSCPNSVIDCTVDLLSSD